MHGYVIITSKQTCSHISLDRATVAPACSLRLCFFEGERLANALSLHQSHLQNLQKAVVIKSIMTSHSINQRSITITYNISIPSEAAASSLSSSSSTTLDPKRSISIPLEGEGDLSSLSKALDKARSETNDTLTQWKDAIGEIEKIKEARVAREAEERKRLAKKAKSVAQGEEQEEEEDAGDSDEDDEDAE